MSRRGGRTAGGAGGLALVVIVLLLLGTGPGQAVYHGISSALHGTTRHIPHPATSTAPPVATGRQQHVTPAQARKALSRLDALTVLAHRPNVPGYQRGCGKTQACSFGPAWTDDSGAPGSHNGCDTRDDLLRKDLHGVTFKAGSRCVVESGTYTDPYTGDIVHWTKAKATTLQVDHVVPLALAWDLGAWRWTQARRTTYANDEKRVLLLAGGSANEAKGDDGPAEWMPPNQRYWCAYDVRFATILAAYRLPVIATDKAAMAGELARCEKLS